MLLRNCYLNVKSSLGYYDVLFNSTKSQVLIFNNLVDVGAMAKLALNGSLIEYVDSALHLGACIGDNDASLNVHHSMCELSSL